MLHTFTEIMKVQRIELIIPAIALQPAPLATPRSERKTCKCLWIFLLAAVDPDPLAS